PVPVCLPPKPLHRGCHLLCTPPGLTTSGREGHTCADVVSGLQLGVQYNHPFTDLEFHVKREVESPDLQTRGEDVSLGLELQKGILCQMYKESGALPLGGPLLDAQTPTCLTSLQPEEDQHMVRTYNMTDLSSNEQHASDSHQFETRRSVQYQTPGRFKCDYCGKGFPFLSMMKGHRLSHWGEEPGLCGMAFIRRSHLKRLHIGVKPFTCQVCGRTFSRSAHLKAQLCTENKLSAARWVHGASLSCGVHNICNGCLVQQEFTR
uniref:C2H2-type domain-containing protein n=1 Tax=Labrus bergylta TaxID=56723 RepID=A0A3Q3FTL4_9LABR